jgi:hypothetical protein
MTHDYKSQIVRSTHLKKQKNLTEDVEKLSAERLIGLERTVQLLMGDFKEN